MRTYETIFILHPDFSGDQGAAIVEKFKTILEDQEARILKTSDWGVRKLAYPIRKQTRGNFILFVYECGPAVIGEFERRLRIEEAVLKFQTVYLEKGFEEEKPKAPETEDAQEESASAEESA